MIEGELVLKDVRLGMKEEYKNRRRQINRKMRR